MPAGSVQASVSISRSNGADTGGALSVVEHPFDVGALVRPHVHTREDEISIVLEGEIGFRSEDQEVVLGVGGYIVKPRDQVHAMWNAGSTPARMIEIISPAGFEGFFRGFADLNDTGPIDPVAIGRTGRAVWPPLMPIPEWLPDIIAPTGYATATAAQDRLRGLTAAPGGTRCQRPLVSSQEYTVSLSSAKRGVSDQIAACRGRQAGLACEGPPLNLT